MGSNRRKGHSFYYWARHVRHICRHSAQIEGDEPSALGGLDAAGFADQQVEVSTDEARQMALRLARKEGLLVGKSSGANVFAALNIARSLPRGSVVVTVLCDSGERYLDVV